MKALKNQRGFAVLEVIVLVALLGVLGFVGYRAYIANQAKPAGTQTKTETKKVDPYAGWKTYFSSYEKASFQYPPTWKVEVKNDPLGDDPPVGGGKIVTLSSPRGMVLIYEDTGFASGGNCEDEPNVVLTSVEQIKEADAKKPLSIIESESKIGITDLNYKTGNIGTCFALAQFDSKSHSGQAVRFGEANVLLGGDKPRSEDQKRDVATARLMLRSFTYK